MLYHQCEMTSLVSAGLAKTLENRMWKLLSLSLFLPNCWHGGVWWGGRLKRHAWTSAVPQWAAKGENHVPRWCLTKANKLSEGKLICQKLAPKCKTVLVCYILFCRHHGDWVSEAESADGITHPSRYWSHFMSAFSGSYTSFVWKDTPLLLRAAGASRIQGIPKGIRSSAKHYIYNITELWHWWYYHVF